MDNIDCTFDSLDSLIEAKRLFYLDQLSAAICLAKKAEESPDLTIRAQILIIRCLFSQGKFRDADAICRISLEASSSESEDIREMRLWQSFLQICLAENSTAALMECETEISRAQERPDNLHLSAVAYDLMGRAKAIVSEWGLASTTNLDEACIFLTSAAKAYRHLGDFDESLNAMIRQGKIYLMGTMPDKDAARKIFQDVQTQALAIGNDVRQAEASLLMAELAFDDMLSRQTVEQDIQVNQTPYKCALAFYIATENILGQANVLFSYGRCLINEGFEGSNALNQALNLYIQEDNLIGVYRTLNALGAWYLHQSEPVDKALSCYQQVAEVADKMCFPLGQATAYMGIGDYFYRIGDYSRSLVAYERSESLAAFPTVRAMVNLVRSNAYTLMNLHDRAEASCNAAIKTLKVSGPNDRLSLANFILGNILVRKGNWVAAIETWKDGLAVDEAINNRLSKAQKLLCIAQATVMQYYHPGGSPIPVTAYKKATTLYMQSIALLREIGGQQAAASIANAHQLQGQSAIACRRYFDALQYLEQARNDYASIGLAMQTAITDVLLGLLYHDLGSHGHPNLYSEAAHCQERALDYFRETGMLEMTWKVCFLSAHTAFRFGLLAINNDEQQEYWQSTVNRLEEAAADIEMVRGRFIEADPIERENARLGLVNDKEKIYTFAIQMHLLYLKNTKSAFNWLERLKGRVFLDALSLTPLRHPTLRDVTVFDIETELLKALNNSSTQNQVVDLNERLHVLWNKMAIDPAAAEYMALRRAEPVNWENVRILLQPFMLGG